MKKALSVIVLIGVLGLSACGEQAGPSALAPATANGPAIKTATLNGWPASGWVNPVGANFEDWGFGSCAPPYDGNYAHLGADSQGSPAGQAVAALGAGTVVGIRSGWPGNAVGIEHVAGDGSRFVAIYGHINAGVAVGQQVAAGETIGSVYDQSGNSHLHLGIRPLAAGEAGTDVAIKGRADCAAFTTYGLVDPIPWLAGHSVTTQSASGLLGQVYGDTTGWHKGNTGLAVSGAVSAVNMGGIWPQVMVAEGGSLYHIYGDSTGWHKGNTGLAVSSTVSAVNMGYQWPQVMVAEGGRLYQIWGDTSGWHKADTGIAVSGTVSAVNMGGIWPQVMVAEGGRLFHIYGDVTGWHKGNTGIAASGEVSAVNMGGQWPQVMASESGLLVQIYGDATGWHKGNTGIAVSGAVSAVNMGGVWPQVMVAEGGSLYHIYGDSAGWHKGNTGINVAGPISAVNMGYQWPQIMNLN